MSSIPLRNSDFSAEPACNARSKLSSTGRRVFTASASAYSRNSCCSRAVRLRAFSNSACKRARRSRRLSRSAFSLSNSESATLTRADREVSETSFGVVCSAVSSDAGNSCSVSNSRSLISVFPLLLAIRHSLRFVQDFVKQARDIGNGVHGVLIINARGTNHRERSHHLATHAGRCSYEHKVPHGR